MAAVSGRELKLLEETFFFQNVAPEKLRAAAEDPRCHMAEHAKGETICTPHAFDHALGVVLTGKVQVSKAGLLVSILGPGDLFGAASLFNDREDYAATLTARAKCRLLFFPQRMVTELMAKDPTLAANYIRYLSGRIRFLEGKLDGLMAGSAERRLGQYLLSRAGEGTDCSLTDLAGRLGVSRASLYRALDALCDAGAIEKSGKTVRILKEELLV